MAAVAIANCAPQDPAAIARAADARAGSGIYTWLAEHDPSKLVVVGIDAGTAREIAPDARVSIAPDVASGCRRARATHALLAVSVHRGAPARDRADDCGFAIFRDDVALVIAPR